MFEKDSQGPDRDDLGIVFQFGVRRVRKMLFPDDAFCIKSEFISVADTRRDDIVGNRDHVQICTERKITDNDTCGNQKNNDQTDRNYGSAKSLFSHMASLRALAAFRTDGSGRWVRCSAENAVTHGFRRA